MESVLTDCCLKNSFSMSFCGLKTDHFFLFLNNVVWMDHSLFIYSPVVRHLGCFQFLAIMNKASINIYVQVLPRYKFSIHLGNYPREGLLGYMIRLCLTL